VGREAKGNEVGPDGWLRTGDLGRLDDEGYLFVLDRRDDLIISGGENVFPAEIEGVLLTHPGVAEAAVIGVPDARWGAVPVAFVRRKVGWATTEDELLALCATRLADFKRPQRITWIDALPRNASGKLLRRELRTNA
jgi:O-succinylbenzoic acid--CoA ligase